MTLQRRVEALEASVVAATHELMPTPAEIRQRGIRDAERCGLTEREVFERFGSWQDFTYAQIKGAVHYLDEPEPPPIRLKPGQSEMEAYMEMIRVPAPPGPPWSGVAYGRALDEANCISRLTLGLAPKGVSR